MRLIQLEGEGMLSITETEPGKNMHISLDKTKIETIGKKVVGMWYLLFTIDTNIFY